MERLVKSSEYIEPNCSKCALQGLPKVHGYGNTGDTMFIMESPGIDDINAYMPLQGRKNSILTGLVKSIGGSMDRVYTTYLCLCRPSADRKLSKSEIRSCNNRLIAEIHLCNPKIIVIFGTTLSKYFFNKPITTIRGTVQSIVGIPAIATFSPNNVYNSTGQIRDLITDITRVFNNDIKPAIPVMDDGYSNTPYEVLNDFYDIVTTLDEMKGVISIDIETSNVKTYEAHIGPIGLHEIGLGDLAPIYIIPESEIHHEDFKEFWNTFIKRKDIEPLYHNAQYEWGCFYHSFGIDSKISHDTILMHFLLDERSGGSDDVGFGNKVFHSLKKLGTTLLNLPDWSEPMKGYTNYLEVPDDVLYRYLAMDVKVTSLLYEKFAPEIEKQGLNKILTEVMYPAIKHLSYMNIQGVALDEEYLQHMVWEWAGEASLHEERIIEQSGKPDFKITNASVPNLLFEHIGYERIRGNHAGKEEIEALIQMYPNDTLLTDIKEYRKLTSYVANYGKGLKKQIRNNTDGKIHTSFSLFGADTGRLNSAGPNLMNVAKKARGIFTADDNYDMVELDYKQLEIVVGAWISECPHLREYIESGKDIHNEMGVLFHGCPVEDITDLMRVETKTVVFGIWYDITAYTLALKWGIEEKLVQRRIDMFYERFPRVKEWKQEVRELAEEEQQITSPWGRVKRFPLITNENKNHCLRQAINAPIQGTASDITQIGLANIFKTHYDLITAKVIVPILTVHDQGLYLIKSDRVKELVPKLVTIMETPPLDFSLPLKVDVAVGPSWGTVSKEHWKHIQETQ